MSEYLNIKDIKNYKEILQVLENIDSVLKEYVSQSIRNYYRNIDENICSLCNKLIDNRILVNKENIKLSLYAKEQYELISETINLINQNKFENSSLFQVYSTIKKSLEDKRDEYKKIANIKDSKLNEFDEVTKFLSKNCKYYKMKFQVNEQKYINESYEIIKNSELSQLVKLVGDIYSDIFITDLDNFYQIYENAINDIDNITHKLQIYDLKDFVVKDRKSISEILDLMTNFELSFVEYPENDLIAIKIISTSIVDMFNKTKDEYIKIENEERVDLIKARAIGLQTFKNTIEKSVVNVVSDEENFLRFSKFIQSVTELVNELQISIKNNFIGESDSGNLSLVQIDFAREIVDCFNEIIDRTYKVNGFINKSKSSEITKKTIDILNGINETLALKVEKINENIVLFKYEYLKETIKLTDFAISELKDIFFTISDDRKNKISIFEKIQLMEDFIKDNKNNMFNIQLGIDFKQQSDDFILFSILEEVAIYDSFINDCLDSLADDGSYEITNFIKFNRRISDKIFETINKHNIERIYPNVNDKVDTKKHTILEAQLSNDFKKGQIIEVINTGFKEDNKVLLKAVVVCAL